MKLIFFLVAFCLVSIRVYFSWSGNDKQNRGISETSMVVKADNFYEEIKYSGKFRLTEDETAFKSISPGGYFKYKKNEVSVKAESNLNGEIAYTVYNGKNNLPFDEQGKKLVAEAVKEMVAWGFDAKNRMERIFEKGGARALLIEVDSLKMDQTKILYLTRLLGLDSLLPGYLPDMIKKIGSLGSDRDKADFLLKIPNSRMNKPLIAEAYFLILDGMGSDMDRASALKHLVEADSISNENTLRLVAGIGSLGSDMDKKSLYLEMIEKEPSTGPCFDSLLTQVSHLGSDVDKAFLYSKLSDQKNLSELQWIGLINQTAGIGSEMDRANLLISYVPKMPETVLLHETCLTAAKSIQNDMLYGSVMRAFK